MAILDKGWSNVTPNFSGSNKAMGNSIQALSNAGTLFDKLNNTLEQQQQNDINNALNFKKMALAEQENTRQQAEFDLTMKTNEESAQALEMMDALQTKYTRKDGSIDLQGFGVEATKLRQNLTTAGAEALATKFLTDAFARNDTVGDNRRADRQLDISQSANARGWAQFDLEEKKFNRELEQEEALRQALLGEVGAASSTTTTPKSTKASTQAPMLGTPTLDSLTQPKGLGASQMLSEALGSTSLTVPQPTTTGTRGTEATVTRTGHTQAELSSMSLPQLQKVLEQDRKLQDEINSVTAEAYVLAESMPTNQKKQFLSAFNGMLGKGDRGGIQRAQALLKEGVYTKDGKSFFTAKGNKTSRASIEAGQDLGWRSKDQDLNEVGIQDSMVNFIMGEYEGSEDDGIFTFFSGGISKNQARNVVDRVKNKITLDDFKRTIQKTHEKASWLELNSGQLYDGFSTDLKEFGAILTGDTKPNADNKVYTSYLTVMREQGYGLNKTQRDILAKVGVTKVPTQVEQPKSRSKTKSTPEVESSPLSLMGGASKFPTNAPSSLLNSLLKDNKLTTAEQQYLLRFRDGKKILEEYLNKR